MTLMNTNAWRRPHPPTSSRKWGEEKVEWESCTSLQIILPYLSAIITVSMTSSAVSMGSRSFILWNPNQGTERKPSPSRNEKSHWETHSQWWMLHMCVKVWVCAQSRGIALIIMEIRKRPLTGHHIHCKNRQLNLGRRYIAKISCH